MRGRLALWAISLFVPALVSAPAQAGGDDVVAQSEAASATVAHEMIRVCVDTAASPEAIRALAGQEGWKAVDPTSLPLRSSITIKGKKKGEDRVYSRSSAWNYTRDAVELTIGLFDYPDLPPGTQKQCEVIAWDLDADAVDKAIVGDPRISAEPSLFPGLPMKDYRVRSASLKINYVASDAGSKMVHVFRVD
jgi:hypothetical protein